MNKLPLVSSCKECEGKGKYLVYNAYEPDKPEVVVCNSCKPRKWVN